MREFSLLVKPAAADCNLNCPYCFYRGTSSGRMSPEVLERMVCSYAQLPIAGRRIAFQGGEPLLMGEDFFRRASALGPGVEFSVQTNATLVTDSLARFFSESGWLVGVSPHWDAGVGPAGDAQAGLSGLRRLQSAGVAVNLLQLVTRDNVRRPEELYRHLRDDLGSLHHQYIECTAPAEYAVGATEWGDFLVRQFDAWLADGDEHRVSVRHIDSLVSEIVYGIPTLCQFTGDCRHYLVVESNGDVFPCDFFVRPELRLGNVMTNDWEEMLESAVFAAFGQRKRESADCPRNCGRLDGAWRRFRRHAMPRLERILRADGLI